MVNGWRSCDRRTNSSGRGWVPTSWPMRLSLSVREMTTGNVGRDVSGCQRRRLSLSRVLGRRRYGLPDYDDSLIVVTRSCLAQPRFAAVPLTSSWPSSSNASQPRHSATHIGLLVVAVICRGLWNRPPLASTNASAQ